MNDRRVLIVDDSAVMRQLLRQTVESDPVFRVQGVAANGRIALAMIAQSRPDAIVLDIEMPEMDGLACLREIRRTDPLIPVIMCSTLTEQGAAITLDALSLGASDYVTKPSSTLTVGASPMGQLKSSLLPKLRALCRVGTEAVEARVAKRFPGVRPKLPVRIVAIGASTGGPNALAEVLGVLPEDFAVPIVIVQHMPPVFTRLMAERLHKTCSIPVREAYQGARLLAGEAWIAAGDRHLKVVEAENGYELQLSYGPAENSCRPAVDVLFRSVAQTHGAGVLGIVLTGMGYDGLRGSERIRDAGGRVLVQDEASCVVWGMPGAVAQAGLADEILPLPNIGSAIVQAVNSRPLTAVAVH